MNESQEKWCILELTMDQCMKAPIKFSTPSLNCARNKRGCDRVMKKGVGEGVLNLFEEEVWRKGLGRKGGSRKKKWVYL